MLVTPCALDDGIQCFETVLYQCLAGRVLGVHNVLLRMECRTGQHLSLERDLVVLDLLDVGVNIADEFEGD